MSERNENELNDKEQRTNEEIERELEESGAVNEEPTGLELDKNENDEDIADNTDSQVAPTAHEPSSKNSTAIVVPWVIAAIAIAALIFVLLKNPTDGLNKTVGSMDGATFTTADLYEEMSKQGGEEQQASLLDSLMTVKLINLEAEEAGATVSDADIKAELDKIKTENNIPTDEALEAALQQSGMTLDSFKEQISTQMKLRKIFEKNNPASEADMKAYFEKNKEQYSTPKQVQASHILLQTKEEAEAVLAELKAGKDFATLAKEKSQDPGSKGSGGELGYFGKGQMNAGFEEAAFKLAKGEMSGVVEAESGFHIIKVTDIKEAVTPTYDEVKDKVKQGFYDEKIQAEGQAWMEQAKKDRNFKNLLTKEPEPTASASAGASPEATPEATATTQE
ncbi:peptidylprolyl isomerase [Cohnella luojiensis]|uniref:peptidylprolyl isomerase n=1 Tax=Cohnella luojiensis TaxID=652876 RepID=A0A4Y8M3A5_9BACL|nr:peptidylprolyl isomerase [Cohnella luojiensis]TFE29911.1 hypothetical protein E2980_03880 [Cohnella luojiensis]